MSSDNSPARACCASRAPSVGAARERAPLLLGHDDDGLLAVSCHAARLAGQGSLDQLGEIGSRLVDRVSFSQVTSGLYVQHLCMLCDMCCHAIKGSSMTDFSEAKTRRINGLVELAPQAGLQHVGHHRFPLAL